MIRSDLECKTRTNLPINHCAEMLTRTLRSEVKLFAQPPFPIYQILFVHLQWCKGPVLSDYHQQTEN
ncbi:hypothetical protein EI219_10950 [Streptococcus suis]|uniref:Uncharacterized protein n=1 Tax=Streptococcus suis TaxID=1307 RepID=A0A3R8LXK9_STRSU|nr:hypothetical protein EI219_10950 [Streptococcus suis]